MKNESLEVFSFGSLENLQNVAKKSSMILKENVIGDFPKLSESYLKCVGEVWRVVRGNYQDMEIKTDADITALVAVVGDYFYWVDKTARSGYVKREYLKGLYQDLIIEQVEALLSVLEEMDYLEILKEAFIVLGVQMNVNSYNRAGLLRILERKIELEISEVADEESPTIANKEVMLRPCEYVDFVSDIGEGQEGGLLDSIEPNSLSVAPGVGLQKMRKAFYLAVSSTVLIGGVGGAFLLSKGSDKQNSVNLEAGIQDVMVDEPASLNVVEEVHEKVVEALDAGVVEGQKICVLPKSSEKLGRLESYLVRLEKGGPKNFGFKLRKIVENLSVSYRENLSEEQLRILLMKQILSNLEKETDNFSQTFVSVHSKALQQYESKGQWLNPNSETAMIFYALEPVCAEK